MNFQQILFFVLKLSIVISVASASKEKKNKDKKLKEYVADLYIIHDWFVVEKIITIWNGLRHDTKNSNSLNCFKCAVDRELQNLRYHESDDPIGDIHNDTDYYLNYANQVFKTMNQYGLNFEVRVVTMELDVDGILHDSNDEDPQPVGASWALAKFLEWQVSKNTAGRINYDIAILFTGLDIAGVNGLTHCGQLCANRTVGPFSGVIEFEGFGTASTIAHEIGHMLGASHDGYASYNVMRSSRYTTSADRFSFSRCTVVDILNNLDEYGDHCLLDHDADPERVAWEPSTTADSYTGPLWDANYACRREFGKEARACHLKEPDDDKKCLRIPCMPDKNASTCQPVLVPEGMPCDKNKVCKLGQCVPDTSGAAKHTIPGCMYGDIQALTFDGETGTCEDLYDIFGGQLCFKTKQCCATCYKQEKLSKIPGCYGDSRKILSRDGPIDCSTAIGLRGARTVCSESTFFKERCCKICDEIRGDPDCPYDKKGITWTGGEFTLCDDLEDRDCEREDIQVQCCKRCANFMKKRSVQENMESTETTS